MSRGFARIDADQNEREDRMSDSTAFSSSIRVHPRESAAASFLSRLSRDPIILRQRLRR